MNDALEFLNAHPMVAWVIVIQGCVNTVYLCVCAVGVLFKIVKHLP